MYGIDFLRNAVSIFNDCSEDFNQRFTSKELLQIAEAHAKSAWDVYPDQWSNTQIEDCIKSNKVPDWEYIDNRLVPKYVKYVKMND